MHPISERNVNRLSVLEQKPLNSTDLKEELCILKERLKELEVQRNTIRGNKKGNKNPQQWNVKWSEIRSEISCLVERISMLNKDIAIYEDLEINGCFGPSLLGRCISGISQIIAIPITIAGNFAVNHPFLAVSTILASQITGVFTRPLENDQVNKNSNQPSNESTENKSEVKEECAEFSFMAMVRHRNARLPNGVCSGTVVAKNKVLTAQHCVTQFGWGNPRNMERSDLLVHQGCETTAEMLKSPHCTYNVVNVENHPAYLQGKEVSHANDLSLLTVERDFKCAEIKRVISDGEYVHFKEDSHRLNHQINHDPVPNPRNNILAHGFGIDHLNRKDLSENVKSVPMTTYHDSTELLCDTMICAQNFNSLKVLDTCQGDSGGPLFWSRNETSQYVGIVSSGGDNCNGGNSLNVDLHAHKDWIEAHTQNSLDACMDIQITKNHKIANNGETLSHMKIINNCDKRVETSFKSDCYHTKERKVLIDAKSALNLKHKKSVNIADCGKGPSIKNKGVLRF